MEEKNRNNTKEDGEGLMLEAESHYKKQLEGLNNQRDNIKKDGIKTLVALGVSVAVSFWLVSRGGFYESFVFQLFLPLLATLMTAAALLSILSYTSLTSRINQTTERMRIENKLRGAYLYDRPAVGNSSAHVVTPATPPATRNLNDEYFSRLVEINIENLSSYYEQVRSHANKSFVVSVVMSIFGFLIITAGLIYGFVSPNRETIILLMSSASGIVMEAISALFFYLYSKTVRQMKDYHDGLLYVQNILLSLKLIESLDGKEIKAKIDLMNKTIEYLLCRKAQ